VDGKEQKKSTKNRTVSLDSAEQYLCCQNIISITKIGHTLLLEE